MIEFEHEALAETGNVIHVCLATIANVLKKTMHVASRRDPRGWCDVVAVPPGGGLVLFSISISRSEPRHARLIALLMDLPSIAALKEIVQDFIEKVQQ